MHRVIMGNVIGRKLSFGYQGKVIFFIIIIIYYQRLKNNFRIFFFQYKYSLFLRVYYRIFFIFTTVDVLTNSSYLINQYLL